MMTSSLEGAIRRGIDPEQAESRPSIKQAKVIPAKAALFCLIFIAMSIACNANGEDLGSFTNLQKAIEATNILSGDAYKYAKEMFDYGWKEVTLRTKDGNVVITIIEDRCRNASEKADPDKYRCRKYHVTVTKN
jgi:hypothetical protein